MLKDSVSTVSIETDATGPRFMPDEEVAAFAGCCKGLSRVKRKPPKKLRCIESRESSKSAATSSSEDMPRKLSASEQKRAENARLVRIWYEKSAEARARYSGFNAFEREHNITDRRLRAYITADGILTLRGERLLNLEPQRVAITQEHIDKWPGAKAENRKLTRTAFARSHFIDPQTFRSYVTPEGPATARWYERLEPTVHSMTPKMLEVIQKWLTHENRDAMSMAQFANRHGVLGDVLSRQISKDGILTAVGRLWLDSVTKEFTPRARALIADFSMKKRNVMPADILAWQRIASGEAPKMTQEIFAKDNHISRKMLGGFVNSKGLLTPRGERKLASQPVGGLRVDPTATLAGELNQAPIYQPVVLAHLEALLLPTEPGQATSLRRFAELNGLDIDELRHYVSHERVLFPDGWEKLQQSTHLPGSSQAAIAGAQIDRVMTFEDAIAHIRTPGQWVEGEADIVPRLAGDYFQRQDRGVAVRVFSANSRDVSRVDEFPPGGRNLITLELHGAGTLGAHYSATRQMADGQLVALPTAGGGDCFYRALFATANRLDPERVTAEQIQTLRNQIADHLRDNPLQYYDFLRTEH